MKLTTGCAAAALLLMAPPPPGAAASQKVLQGDRNWLDEAFEALALETLHEFHVPGLAIGVVDGDKTWTAGYGNATLPAAPVTPSTLFYGGSTTKAFTAAAFAQLIDAGTVPGLSWRTPLASLIRDDFVLRPADAWAQAHLTVEDALSHRTGFPRHDKALSTQYGPDQHKATMRDVTRMLRDLPAVGEPRDGWRYCNLMYMVASHALQTLTGRWLGTTLRERLWRPLGMNATYFSLDEARAAPEPLATGYWWDYGGASSGAGGFRPIAPMGLDEAGGAGAVVSNVGDYAKWLRCLLGESAPLSAAGHAAVRTPRVVPAGGSRGFDGPVAYALGWFVGTYRGHPVYSHSGGMEAYGAEVFFLPDAGFGVVTLANTAMTSNLAGLVLARRLIDDKLGVPAEERLDWVASGKQSVDDALASWDKAVDRLYPERADHPRPPALRLQEYAGVYTHPAYHNLTVEVVAPVPGAREGSATAKTGKLEASRDDEVWQMTYDFEHVSGEFWIIYIDMKNTPNRLLSQVAKAEFRLGPSGRVEEMVVEYLEDQSEGVIVYNKIV